MRATTTAAAVVAVVAVVLVMAAPAVAIGQTRAASVIDRYDAQAAFGARFLTLTGWSATDGTYTDPILQIDGQTVAILGSGLRYSRSDVCSALRAAGWSCADERARICGYEGLNPIVSSDCVGVTAHVDISYLSAGRHTVRICAAENLGCSADSLLDVDVTSVIGVIDVAELTYADGRVYLRVAGWVTGNGVAPRELRVTIDGVVVSTPQVRYRPDVCPAVTNALGWVCTATGKPAWESDQSQFPGAEAVIDVTGLSTGSHMAGFSALMGSVRTVVTSKSFTR